jgi:hypothetical protein
MLRLALLAPDIVEAILDGRQRNGLRLAEMMGNGPLGWSAQRERLGLQQLTRPAQRGSVSGPHSWSYRDRRAAGGSTRLSGLRTEAAVLASDVGRQGLAKIRTFRAGTHADRCSGSRKEHYQWTNR